MYLGVQQRKSSNRGITNVYRLCNQCVQDPIWAKKHLTTFSLGAK